MTEDIEPQLEEDYVKIQYWKCHVLGHRHRTKKAAATCMLKRKGESGELKKLQRNISMIQHLQQGEPIQHISNTHNCSSPNVIKAVNSSLKKAWNYSHQHGGCPYPQRNWTVNNFIEDNLQKELSFLMEVLLEQEVKLKRLTE